VREIRIYQPSAKCKRCGRCCIVFQGGDANDPRSWLPCKYLIQYIQGGSYCFIYPHRIGAITGKGQGCIRRNAVPYDIPDCPFNDNKPLHPFYKAQLNKYL